MRGVATKVTPVSRNAARAALTVCIAALTMAGCGGTDAATTSTPPPAPQPTTAVTSVAEQPATTSSTAPATTTASSTPTGDRAAWGEPLAFDDVTQGISLVVMLGVPEDVPDSEMGMADPELDRLVALPIEVENLGSAVVEVLPEWFELEGDDVVVYEAAPLTDSPVELLAPSEVAPGGEVAGYIAFEVPEAVQIVTGACEIGAGVTPGGRLTWSR